MLLRRKAMDVGEDDDDDSDAGNDGSVILLQAVSYTHLTLPTNHRV